MKERYKLIPEVFLLLVKEGQILLSRRYQTGYEDGNYGLPAGHGEEGETMREGVEREALEEIGLTLTLTAADFALTQHRWCADQAHARVGFYFAPRVWEGEPVNKEPEKCDDLRWFPLDALPENIVGHVRAAIETYRKGDRYAEYAWPPRQPSYRQ